MADLPAGALVLLGSCAAVQPDEVVVIVADASSAPLAETMYRAASPRFETVVVTMRDRMMHGDEPPRAVAAAMTTGDVIFGVTRYSLFHTEARRTACARGARFVNMVDYDESMLEFGGLFVDFAAQAEVVDRVAEAMRGERIEVTSALGTRLVASIKGRVPLPQYGRSVKPGAASSPPDIECAVAPVEGTPEGIIVVDGSIPHPRLGPVSFPVEVRVGRGMVMAITGGRLAEEFRRVLTDFRDENAFAVGEIGIGLNPMATIRGRMLEDEGVYGTVHFGLGSNRSFGGNIAAQVHLDLVIRAATCVVDGRTILRNGKLCEEVLRS